MRRQSQAIMLGIMTAVFAVLQCSHCISQELSDRQMSDLTERLTAAHATALDAELIDTENKSLRAWIREHEEPIVLVRPEYIVQTRVVLQQDDKEVVVAQQDDPFQYDYTLDNGLIVARYLWANQEHNFITPQLSFDMQTEVNADNTAVQLYATSSLNANPILLDTVSTSTSLNKTHLRCPWCWFAAGTAIGIGSTATAVKLAGELR